MEHSLPLALVPAPAPSQRMLPLKVPSNPNYSMILCSQTAPYPPRFLRDGFCSSRKSQGRSQGTSPGEKPAPQLAAQRSPALTGTPSPHAPPELLTGLEIARLFVSVAAVACGRADARLSAPTLFGLLLTSPWAAINPEFLYLASGFPRAALSPARNYSCWDLPLSWRIL